MIVATAIYGALWSVANDELRNSGISGNAYRDYGTIGAHDGFEPPIKGLLVQLFQVGKDIPIKETEVDEDGEYEFIITEPGTYRVQAVHSVDGYPGWNYITTLRSKDILVEEGENYNGPIFLVREDEGPKG
jgi:hypothetical protein